jgi:hypothetical protein
MTRVVIVAHVAHLLRIRKDIKNDLTRNASPIHT